MQITITVADKIVKTAIENALENNLYDQYDADIIKAAKLPKMATVVKEIFNDAKFQKDLTKHLTQVAVGSIEDCVYDDLCYEIELPLLDDLISKCDAVTQEEQAAYLQEQEAKEVERMVKTLERAGYKLVKA
jgi:hypothetical protein